ncbi:MAG: hypothetical protein ACEQSA_02095 [Weeksellaceae bacterium]
MLTIICGEDSAASRNHLNELRKSYHQKGFHIQQVALPEVIELHKNGAGVMSLFAAQSVYIVENLSKLYKGRTKTAAKTAVEELAKDKNIILIDWEEEKSAYELTSLKKLASSFQEYKLSATIFQLQETCYPGNLNVFLQTLRTLTTIQDEGFVFAMLWKHIRKLILVSEGILPAGTAPWQKGKLQAQARSWQDKRLVDFYEGLTRIDIRLKTSASVFSQADSIEVLACYFLR